MKIYAQGTQDEGIPFYHSFIHLGVAGIALFQNSGRAGIWLSAPKLP